MQKCRSLWYTHFPKPLMSPLSFSCVSLSCLVSSLVRHWDLLNSCSDIGSISCRWCWWDSHLTVLLLQVKSTYLQVVKAWCSHTVGNSTSWWTRKGKSRKSLGNLCWYVVSCSVIKWFLLSGEDIQLFIKKSCITSTRGQTKTMRDKTTGKSLSLELSLVINSFPKGCNWVIRSS